MKGRIKPGSSLSLRRRYLKIYKNYLPKELDSWLKKVEQLEGQIKKIDVKDNRVLVYYNKPETRPDGTKIVGIDVPKEIVEIIKDG